MPNCMIMIGLPGSGKSTFVKNVFTNMENTKIISRDEIRFSLINNKKEYFSREREVYQIFINNINKALSDGYNVIVDATNKTIKARRQLMAKIIEADYFNACFIDTDVPTCIYQNNKRGGLAKIPNQAIIEQSEQLQPPTYNEGFKRIWIYKNNDLSLVER